MNTTDNRGHVLAELWKQYTMASSKDRPRKQAEILREIISSAEKQRLSWDFYDAWNEYADVRARINWKDRDSVENAFSDAVKAYDEPVVTISAYARKHGTSTSGYKDMVRQDSVRLSGSRNTSFYHYGDVSGLLDGLLADYISNDYEYALWLGSLYGKLESYPYPSGAYAEYLSINQDSASEPARKEKLSALAAKYSGKAVGMFAEGDVLTIEFDSLSSKKISTEEQYKSLYQKCKAFESRRKSLPGEEAKLAKNYKDISGIISQMESKEAGVQVSGDSITVYSRNLSSVNVSVKKDDKKLWGTRIDNPKKSFYVYDTLKVALPLLDDGDYRVVAEAGGKEYGGTYYSRYTLSLAIRRNSDGYGVYAADSESGEPLKKVSLTLKKNGEVLAEAKDFPLGEGFTPLTAEIVDKIKGNAYRYVLSCYMLSDEGITRRSRELRISDGYSESGYSSSEGQYCEIYLDRAAFNPGDTVRYKGILYKGDLRKALSVCEEGTKVNAVLLDSEGNKIVSETLSTDGFGAVAGQFAIPAGLRNGMFSIRLTSGKYSGSESFRVDEFVLPTFRIDFDDIDRVYFPGDTVNVKGRVTAYSGHELSGSTIRYKISSWSESVAEGQVSPGSDGSFAVEFPARKDRGWAMYQVDVSVTDATGETVSARKSVYVNRGLNVSSTLKNSASGEYNALMPGQAMHLDYSGGKVLLDSVAVFVLSVVGQDGNPLPAELGYRLLDEKGKVVYEGTSQSGSELKLDLSDYAQGLFVLEASYHAKDSEGQDVEGSSYLTFIKIDENASVLDLPVKDYYRLLSDEVETGDSIRADFGTAGGKPVWAVAELYGEARHMLECRIVKLSGIRGEDGSLERLSFPYKEEYPDAVYMSIFYFSDGEAKQFSSQVRRRRHSLDLPLGWTVFQDKTLPGKDYKFVLKTLPGVELLASVYDRSTEDIMRNVWNTVSLRQLSAPSVPIYSVAGNGYGWGYAYPEVMMYDKVGSVGGPRRVLMARSMASADVVNAAEDIEMETASLSDEGMGSEEPEVQVRDVFASTLAFEPFILSGEDGDAELSFSTSGKLSTYNVKVFAHDKSMRNALLGREMVVTLPVKLAVSEPKYLYVGDKYEMAVSLSSIADGEVTGTLHFYQYDGRDYKNLKPVKESSARLSLSAGETVQQLFPVSVPDKAGDIGVKLVFVPDGDNSHANDALFVSIPVYEAAQVLTEAHSAVILPGMDKEAELSRLRGEFVNTSSFGAEDKEISIIDMVREALPSEAEPKGEDVLSLSEALYVRLVAGKLGVNVHKELSDSELEKKILACRNADGGFSWFEGMNSSPIITALVLERFAKLRDAGLYDIDLSPSVKYLDSIYFSLDRPLWCGGISSAQYLYVRSMYPSVQFSPEGSGKEFSKRMKEFKKYVASYLVPKGDRGLKGALLPKARRLRTLSNLLSSDEGVALARKWGVSLSTRKKMLSSLEDDVVSLLEYAVEHKDGGIYYPNAVMPFRGLLESEAYAHSLLCDLFTDYGGGFGGEISPSRTKDAVKIADGIRIWLMLQKETQKWGVEPAYVDALNSVLQGSDDVLATKVIILSKTYEAPFDAVKAAGNGFSIERKFLREVSTPDKEDSGKLVRDYKEIAEGDTLEVGEKIRVEYRIWNGENRSFVLIRAPREATLRPVQQLSGYYGVGIRPMRVNSWYSFTPGGYRNVKSSSTEFYFDSYPEENTTLYEDFFVTQRGLFTAPVLEIESLYAPHYRANSAFHGELEVNQ